MPAKAKIYPVGRGTILNAICDMAEMQKGRHAFCDPSNGHAGFIFNMDSHEHAYRFTVEEVNGGSKVILEMAETAEEKMVERTFFLLESILP
jgi:hypothetical protein